MRPMSATAFESSRHLAFDDRRYTLCGAPSQVIPFVVRGRVCMHAYGERGRARASERAARTACTLGRTRILGIPTVYACVVQVAEPVCAPHGAPPTVYACVVQPGRRARVCTSYQPWYEHLPLSLALV